MKKKDNDKIKKSVQTSSACVQSVPRADIVSMFVFDMRHKISKYNSFPFEG